MGLPGPSEQRELEGKASRCKSWESGEDELEMRSTGTMCVMASGADEKNRDGGEGS
jgi:hypothetical protein